jgi:hypothetical protein
VLVEFIKGFENVLLRVNFFGRKACGGELEHGAERIEFRGG